MTTKLRAASFQDGAVTTAKIAASAITNTKIAAGAVDSDAIGSSAIVADKLGIGQIGGRRNLFYNPKFDVAQRGTSFSKTTSSIFTLDRWQAASGSSFNLDTTITQSTTVPSGQGFKHSIKVEADSAVTPSGSDNGGILQKFEQQDVEHFMYGTSDAKSVTLSFWVRSNKTGTYCVQFQTNQGSSASTDRYLHVKEYTISSSNTWEKKILIFPGHTVQAFNATASNGEALRVNWWLATGSDDHVSADTWIQNASFASTSNQVNFMDNADNEWYLCGCQLEVGSVATPFEHRSFGEELKLCERYYYESGGGSGLSQNNNNVDFSLMFPTEMRATPTILGQEGTITVTNVHNTDFSQSSTSISSVDSGKHGSHFRLGNYSSLGNSTSLLFRNPSSNLVTFDAEL